MEVITFKIERISKLIAEKSFDQLGEIFMKMDASKSMNRDAIRNPEAMDHFIMLAQQLDYQQ